MNKFHLSPLEILAKYNELNLPDSFCIVPFTNVILNPSGEVSICRQKGTKHIVGNLKNNSIEEIWNNEYMKGWREEFLTGNIKICKKEIASDHCHLSSGSYFYIDDVQIDINQKELPLKLTANFNGQCNLKCKMCDVWTLENGFYDKINYWEKLRTDFFPYIKEVELLSGEPFIQADTWKLIDEISKVNPDCIWSFTTNAHWKFTDHMKEKLNKIIIKNIIFSVDSFDDEKYAEIRRGGNLKRVRETIKDLSLYNKDRDNKIAYCLHYLVMQDNWKELGSLIDFCNENELMLTVNVLNEPQEYAIAILEREGKEEILNYLLSLDDVKLKRLMRVYLSIVHTMSKVDMGYYLDLVKGRMENAQ